MTRRGWLKRRGDATGGEGLGDARGSTGQGGAGWRRLGGEEKKEEKIEKKIEK